MSTWLALLIYVIGFFVVGIPMGIWSLRVWKKRRSDFASFLLFPATTLIKNVGCDIKREEFMLKPPRQTTLHSFDIEDGDDARHECARYIVLTALLWPIRASYLALAWLIGAIVTLLISILYAFSMLTDRCAELLLRCRRCIRI